MRAPVFVRLLQAVYRLVTGEEPSARVTAALHQFPTYLVGTLLARALSIVAQLYVARTLGADQFGRFSLSLATAMLLTIPMQAAWGAAFVKFAVTRPVGHTAWAPLRATLVLTAVTAAIVVALAVSATRLVTVWLEVPRAVYVLGVGTAVATTVWLSAKTACQGLQAWPRLVLVEVIWALLILVIPYSLRVARGGFDWTIIAVFALAYVLAALPALPYWLATPEEPIGVHLRRQWHFGKYLGGANLVAALPLYGDRFVVNAVAGLSVLGVYQAYALITVGTAVFVAALVSRFMFPLLNLGERAAFLRLFRRGLPWAAVVFFLGAFSVGWVALRFAHYPFYPGLLAIAALSGFVLCLSNFLNDLAATDEHWGPWTVLGANALAGAVFFPLTLILLPRWQVAAPFMAYTVAFTAAATFVYRCIRRR